jgi:hypothetical protein
LRLRIRKTIEVKLTVIVASVLWTVLFCVGCKKQPQAQVEGYRVVGWDGRTQTYTIIRNGTWDGKYLVKRLVVRCYSRHVGSPRFLGGPEAFVSPSACDIHVGQMFVWNPLPKNPQDFVDYGELPPSTFFITQGHGDEQVQQIFTILKEEVINQ